MFRSLGVILFPALYLGDMRVSSSPGTGTIERPTERPKTSVTAPLQETPAPAETAAPPAQLPLTRDNVDVNTPSQPQAQSDVITNTRVARESIASGEELPREQLAAVATQTNSTIKEMNSAFPQQQEQVASTTGRKKSLPTTRSTATTSGSQSTTPKGPVTTDRPAKSPGTKPAPTAPPGPAASDIKVSIGGPITVDTFKRPFDKMANERGESARLELEYGAKGSVGVAKVGAALKAGIEYKKGDDGRIEMTVDTELAAQLGVNVLLAEVGVEAGAKTKATIIFENSDDAAKFMVNILVKVNQTVDKTVDKATGADLVDVKLFDVPDQPLKYSKAPTTVGEVGGFGGVYVDAKTVANFEGSIRTGGSHLSFSGGKTGSVRETTVSAELKLGGVGVKIQAYQTTTEGHPIDARNGTDRGVIVEISTKDLLSKSVAGREKALTDLAGKMNIPAAEVTQFVSGTLNALNSVPGDAKLVIHYQAAKTAQKEGIDGAPIQTPGRQSAPDEFKTQYLRVGIKTEFEAGIDIKGKVVDFKEKLTVSKTEMVYEKIGTETLTYLRNMSSNPTEWRAFVAQNGDTKVTLYDGTPPKRVSMTVNQLAERWASNR